MQGKTVLKIENGIEPFCGIEPQEFLLNVEKSAELIRKNCEPTIVFRKKTESNRYTAESNRKEFLWKVGKNRRERPVRIVNYLLCYCPNGCNEPMSEI
jgi:hypothetical protein